MAWRDTRAATAQATPSLCKPRVWERAVKVRSAGLRRALDHVAVHYDQPLSLAQLARIAGCSREHLARVCRRETGRTIHGHLVRLRLLRAAREVRAGDKIEAVMLGVGYRGKRNFYEQFKARFGVTPGRYRAVAGDGSARDEER
jgi:two-component system, response regulator YesN